MAIQITGNQVKNAAIDSAQLSDNAIVTAKIASAAITSAKMGSNSILEAALSDGSVTLNKLGSASVSTAKLQDASISSAKLQAGSCITSALAALAVTEAKIAAGSVSAGKISNNAVDSTVMNMTASYDFSGGTLRVVTTPSNGNDAVSKTYADNLSSGAHFKKAVVVASGANINLANLPAAIDGQTLATDDRFAVIAQTSGSENGVYSYAGSGNAAARTADMNANDDFPAAACKYHVSEDGCR